MDFQQLHTIELAARNGGDVLAKYFGKELIIEEKQMVSDIRTKADTESEAAILDTIKQYFPEWSVYSEESGNTGSASDWQFIIDPLDGSNNFVMGIPVFTVSIALMHKDEIKAGVIFNPITNQCFSALDGHGSFLDGERIQTNKIQSMERATVAYTCGYVNDPAYTEMVMSKLSKLNIKRCTNFWSPANDYCLLASGKIEAIINNENEIYDFAAGKIIVREAGGKISSFTGQETSDRADRFIASNGTELHESIAQIL